MKLIIESSHKVQTACGHCFVLESVQLNNLCAIIKLSAESQRSLKHAGQIH